MKKILYILILVLPFVGVGQQQNSVVMSAGATGVVGGVTHSYNIGQSIVSTESNVTNTVTQGFFQPYILLCDKHTIKETGVDGICGGDPVSLSLTEGANYPFKIWFLLEGPNNDTLKVNNGITNDIYIPNYPGEYLVRYTDLNCINETNPVEVKLDASAGIPLIGQTGDQLSTTAQGSYQWYILLGSQKYAIYGQQNASYTPIFDGKYYVEVTYGNNGCKVMSGEREIGGFSRNATLANTIVNDDNTVSLSLGEESSVDLFPYPSSESFTLKMLSDYTGDVSVRLIDLEGKEVRTQSLTKNSTMLRGEISTLGLTEGLYGVMIYTNAGVHTSKMLIIE